MSRFKGINLYVKDWAEKRFKNGYQNKFLEKFFRESSKCQEDVKKIILVQNFYFLENEQQISQKSEHMINLNHVPDLILYCISRQFHMN